MAWVYVSHLRVVSLHLFGIVPIKSRNTSNSVSSISFTHRSIHTSMEVFGETGATNFPVARLPWANMGMLRDSRDCPSIQNPHTCMKRFVIIPLQLTLDTSGHTTNWHDLGFPRPHLSTETEVFFSACSDRKHSSHADKRPTCTKLCLPQYPCRCWQGVIIYHSCM